MLRNKLKIFMILPLAYACQTPVDHQTIAPQSLHENIVILEPRFEKFEALGPYEVEAQYDRDIPIDSKESIIVDQFSAKTTGILPILLISHGNFSGKKAHRSQAIHLASWGFHVVTFDLPNRDQWLENGNRLYKFAKLIHESTELIASNADNQRMIMVGHSFGGSATLIALAKGAPVIGAMLLDPAVVHQRVVTAMKKIDLPVVLLGSDPNVFTARGRGRFRRNLHSEMLEISVVHATHDDAQGPSMFSTSSLGLDPFTSPIRQSIFMSLLTVSAIGLSTSGTLDFPLKIFSYPLKIGLLKDQNYSPGHGEEIRER